MKLIDGSENEVKVINKNKMINKVESPEFWPEKLLNWYDCHKRELPWRESKDPYCIWVSEVMSQQTRLEAVIPYYENWMRLFPTPESLASAETDEVIKAWQGLGYYSRARNLQLGVREVVEKYGGKVPANRREVEALKGVGPYTAGAILSIAYNKREEAVDGNVLRVYARLYDIHDDILGSVGKKKITALVQDTLPANRPGDFNEALMDLGATVCIPKSPRCFYCPLASVCLAHGKGNAEQLPVRISKKSTKIIAITVGILEYKGYYLLHRRPDTGLLRSMWEFPVVEVDQQMTTSSKSKKSLATVKVNPPEAYVQIKSLLEPVMSELKFTLTLEPDMTTSLSHIFSHRRWEMRVYRGELKFSDRQSSPSVKELQKQLPGNWCLLKKKDFSTLPWAGPHGKLTVYCT